MSFRSSVVRSTVVRSTVRSQLILARRNGHKENLGKIEVLLKFEIVKEALYL